MYRLIFYIVFTLPFHLFAQDNTGTIRMTLPEALQIARKQQPDLLNAERNIAYAKASAREARSGYLPSLTAEADMRYNPIIQTSVLPANAFNPSGDPKELVPLKFGTPWSGTTGLRLKQPIYDPSKLVMINSSRVAADLAKTQEKKILAEREEEIAKAWYAIMLAKAKLEYAKVDQQRTSSNAALIKEQLNNGRALENELKDANLRIRIADIDREKYELDIFNAQVYLSYMMGYDTLQLIDPVESLIAQSKADTSSWKNLPEMKSAIASRPEIREERINLDISALNLSRSKAGRLPTLNFEGYLGANNFTNTFDPFGNWFGNSFLGLSFRFPIYSGGEKSSQIEKSQIQQDQQKNNIRKLEQQAYYEILNARNNLQYQYKQSLLQQERILVQEGRIEIVRSRMMEGRATAQDLLEEETKLSEFRNTLYQYLYDYLVALATYHRAIGKSVQYVD
jgi:outer membrane protein